jgi:hypothetical protein
MASWINHPACKMHNTECSAAGVMTNWVRKSYWNTFTLWHARDEGKLMKKKRTDDNER